MKLKNEPEKWIIEGLKIPLDNRINNNNWNEMKQ